MEMIITWEIPWNKHKSIVQWSGVEKQSIDAALSEECKPQTDNSHDVNFVMTTNLALWPHLGFRKAFCYRAYHGTINGNTGPRLNIKTVLSTYGDFHVKDKTAVRTSYL